MIYLDHNATTPIDPRVAEEFAADLQAGWLNPASQHRAGAAARQALEEAREAIGRLAGAVTEGRQPDRVVFTSGGTEANNLALRGLAGESPSLIAISGLEHPSIAAPAEELERRGWDVARLSADRGGVVRQDELERALARQPRLVALMLANHETGVVQPIRQVAERCRAAGVALHVDAVQAAGKWPLEFRSLGASTMTISAHKLGGPIGIGALLVRHDVSLPPMLFGGFQQQGWRPGTESVPLARAFARALGLWEEERGARLARMRECRDLLESRLREGLTELVVQGGEAPERLPHTSCIAFLGVDRQALMMALDLADICCSTGSACQSGSSQVSPVLRAMGCSASELAGSLRFSVGPATSPLEIDQAARRIISSVNHLRRRS